MEKRNCICLAVDDRKKWDETLNRLYKAGAAGNAKPDRRPICPNDGGLLYLHGDGAVSWDYLAGGQHMETDAMDIHPISWLTDERLAELLSKSKGPFETWAAPGKFVRIEKTGEIARVAGRCGTCADDEVHLGLGWTDEIPKQPLKYWTVFDSAKKLASLEPWVPRDGEIVEPAKTAAFGLKTPADSLLRMEPDGWLSIAYPDGRIYREYRAPEYAREGAAAAGLVRPTNREWPSKNQAKISLDWLRSCSACHEGLRWFENAFEKGAEASVKAIFAALEADEDPAAANYAKWLKDKLAR